MSRNYTPAQKTEIQKRLTELVRTHGRMTFGELRKITGLTIFTARHYLEKAESCGDLYQAGRSGIFPSEQAFRLWKQKREDARVTRFLKTPEGVVSSYDRTRNVICTEYPNSLRRTMQRRVREWKLQYGAEQEVMFRQRHQPGLRGLSDFTELKGVVVTIAGNLLAHKLYHFRLEWSHWSWMRVVLGGESFTALAEGLQEALGQLGGVPAEHKTDSLRAAWKQQGEDGRRELTERYAALCRHYGMQGVHNNAGRGHENGSVESAHGHLKRRIRQALILRGSNNFSTLEEYQAFITQQVMRHNRNNQDLVKEERPHLKPLPLRRSADYDELTVRVSSSSTINVRHVIYSVPSRLVGQLLWVRLWDDRLSCYVGINEVMSCPRVRPEKGKTRARRIDFRHVIDSLAKKPGAFCHATLRNDILPDDEWRRLWRRLCNHLEPDMAGRLMVHALKLAAG